MSIDEQVLVFRVLDQSKMVIKVVGEEEGEIVDELLVFIIGAGIGCFDV